MLVDLSQLISNQNYLILGVDPQSPALLIAMAYPVLVGYVADLSACYLRLY